MKCAKNNNKRERGGHYLNAELYLCRKLKLFVGLFIHNVFSESKYICHVIMSWVVEFLHIWKITVSYILCCLHWFQNVFADNFHSMAIIRNLTLVRAAEPMLMWTEMKKPNNRTVKTRCSQLQDVKKNDLTAKNRGMGWVTENLINTDVNVCTHITPQCAGLLFATVAKQKVCWLCGSCNGRVKPKSFWFDQRYLSGSLCVLMSVCV